MPTHPTPQTPPPGRRVDRDRFEQEFIARLSHELRTPLAITTGFTATLLDRWERLDDGARRDLLRRIEAANARLEYLVEELLAVAALDEEGAGRLVSLRVVGLLNQVRAEASEPSRVEIRCAPDLRITSDPMLLRRALGLLVDNSLKYAGDARLDAGGSDGETVVLSVVDHGPGVPAGMRGAIFERFFRGPGRRPPGMGLGLPQVRAIAERLGATVEVEDAPDAGVVFRLRLPDVRHPAPTGA